MTEIGYFELRLYEMVHSRLRDFHDLMEKHALPLFERHGFSRPLGMWEGFSGPITPLYGYLLHWRNLDDRMQAWGHFYSDPEWIAAMNGNYDGEQRVERANISFMKASSLWDRGPLQGGGSSGGPYELRQYDCSSLPDGKSHELIRQELMALQMNGGVILGVFENWIGARCPAVCAFIAWTGESLEWRHSLSGSSPVKQRLVGMSRVPRDSFLFRPTAYGLAKERFAI